MGTYNLSYIKNWPIGVQKQLCYWCTFKVNQKTNAQNVDLIPNDFEIAVRKLNFKNMAPAY